MKTQHLFLRLVCLLCIALPAQLATAQSRPTPAARTNTAGGAKEVVYYVSNLVEAVGWFQKLLNAKAVSADKNEARLRRGEFTIRLVDAEQPEGYAAPLVHFVVTPDHYKKFLEENANTTTVLVPMATLNVEGKESPTSLPTALGVIDYVSPDKDKVKKLRARVGVVSNPPTLFPPAARRGGAPPAASPPKREQ